MQAKKVALLGAVVLCFAFGAYVALNFIRDAIENSELFNESHAHHSHKTHHSEHHQEHQPSLDRTTKHAGYDSSSSGSPLTTSSTDPPNSQPQPPADPSIDSIISSLDAEIAKAHSQIKGHHTAESKQASLQKAGNSNSSEVDDVLADLGSELNRAKQQLAAARTLRENIEEEQRQAEKKSPKSSP